MSEPSTDAAGVARLSLTVEHLRLVAYAGFWGIVLVGIILTKYVARIDTDDTLLTEVFGYNNICVYFDYPPSNQVLPFLWSITLVLLLAYLGSHWLRMRTEVAAGHLSRNMYRALTTAVVFEALTMMGFSTIFAVSPEGWDKTLYIHTLPFFGLQVGLVSLAISNTVHGIASSYWRRLGLSEGFHKAAVVYCLLFAVVVAWKIPAASNAMAGQLWYEQTATLTAITRGMDVLFMLFGAVVPMGMAAWLSWKKADQLDVVEIAAR